MKKIYLIIILLNFALGYAQEISWIERKDDGYLMPNYIQIYDENLNPIGHLNVDSLTPIKILQRTIDYYAEYDISDKSNCNKANFVEILYDQKKYHVFGKYVLFPFEEIPLEDITLSRCNSFVENTCYNQHDDDFYIESVLVVTDTSNQHYLVLDQASDYDVFTLILNQDYRHEFKNFKYTDNQFRIGVCRLNNDTIEFFHINLTKNAQGWSVSDTSSAYTIESTLAIGHNPKAETIHDYALAIYYQVEMSKTDQQRHKSMQNFIDFMEEQIKTNPVIMREHNFYLLDRMFAWQRVNSEDKKLTLYSFNKHLDGSEQDYAVFVQIQGNEQFNVYQLPKASTDDTQFSVSRIFTIPYDSHPYYILLADIKASHRDLIQIAKAYSIHNQRLKPIKLFRTSKKKYTEIPVAYDFFEAMNYITERPMQIITFDPIKKQILFPLINKNKKFTNQSLVYQWTGQYFDYHGVE